MAVAAGSRGARFAARFRAVQALAWWEAEGWTDAPETMLARYDAMSGAARPGPRDDALFAAMVAGVGGSRAALDANLRGRLPPKWSAELLDSTLRALLRAGAWELTDRSQPRAAILSAWVDVARAFFGEGPELGVTNAVLDGLTRSAEPDGRNHSN